LVIVLILVFFLALVLVGLDYRNKKLRDQISVLEQTVEIKDESIVYYMQTFEAAQEAIKEDSRKEQELVRNHEEIAALKKKQTMLKQESKKQQNKNFDLEKSHEKVIEEVTEKIFMLEKKYVDRETEFKAIQKTYETNVSKKENEKKVLEEALGQKEKQIVAYEEYIKTLNLDNAMLEKSFEKTKEQHKVALNEMKQNH